MIDTDTVLTGEQREKIDTAAPTPEPKRKRKPAEEPPKRRHPISAMRRRGVPLVAIETADPKATIDGCIASLNGNADKFRLIKWDACTGAVGLNEPGAEYVEDMFSPQLKSINPTEFLKTIGAKPPADSIVFVCNAHLIISTRGDTNLQPTQGIWNCRDSFKGERAMLVLLAPGFKLPPELSQDVVLISEPVPTEKDIERVVQATCKNAGIGPEKVDMQKCVDGLIGYLAEFPIEQSLAISLTENGPDYEKLWELKVAALKQTAGLEITLPKLNFGDMAGNDGVKNVLRMHLAGSEPPRAVLWFDEIEKMLAAGTSDLSGTTQAVLEQFLYWTQSRRVKGFLLAGVPGAGKSLTVQAVAGEAKCPLMRASMSTVKGGIVGETEANTARLFKAIDAVAQGRVLLLSTCNSLDVLSPEVMARHNMGMFFYDYPTEPERKAVIDFYRKKYPDVAGQLTNIDNWVGREIESCFEKASLWKIPLEQAARTVVTSARANREKLEDLRDRVSGRFLSAATGDVYENKKPNKVAAAKRDGARKIDLGE